MMFYAGYVSGNHNIYIGVKVTSTTTYYNDVAIAGVQIVNKDVIRFKKRGYLILYLRQVLPINGKHIMMI